MQAIRIRNIDYLRSECEGFLVVHLGDELTEVAAHHFHVLGLCSSTFNLDKLHSKQKLSKVLFREWMLQVRREDSVSGHAVLGRAWERERERERSFYLLEVLE